MEPKPIKQVMHPTWLKAAKAYHMLCLVSVLGLLFPYPQIALPLAVSVSG